MHCLHAYLHDFYDLHNKCKYTSIMKKLRFCVSNEPGFAQEIRTDEIENHHIGLMELFSTRQFGGDWSSQNDRNIASKQTICT